MEKGVVGCRNCAAKVYLLRIVRNIEVNEEVRVRDKVVRIGHRY